MKAIELDGRIKVCTACFLTVRGRVCSCGEHRTITMSPMSHKIMLALEEMDAPINMVDCHTVQDAELLKSARLA